MGSFILQTFYPYFDALGAFYLTPLAAEYGLRELQLSTTNQSYNLDSATFNGFTRPNVTFCTKDLDRVQYICILEFPLLNNRINLGTKILLLRITSKKIMKCSELKTKMAKFVIILVSINCNDYVTS